MGSFGTGVGKFERAGCKKGPACMSNHPAWPEDGCRRLYISISGHVACILLGFGSYNHITHMYHLAHINSEMSARVAPVGHPRPSVMVSEGGVVIWSAWTALTDILGCIGVSWGGSLGGRVGAYLYSKHVGL